MSNYPLGTPCPRKFTVTMYCTNDTCNHVWGAVLIEDLGQTRFEDETDADCPECGAEGV